MQIYAHVDGTDWGLHHFIGYLAVFAGAVGMYLTLFWAKVRAAASWLRKKLFRSR